ncbi:MAG: hypothetical protein QOG65_613, partial [Actinomycetota bacterium]|nr:hypothetical protein [Actinomycetota bacterium]
DVEHAVHLRGHDDDGVAERCGAPCESGAAAPRDEGPSVTPGDAHRGCNLRAGTRKAHRVGSADRDPGVTRVQRELERFVTRTTLTDAGAKVDQELLMRRVGVRDTPDATD